MTNLPDRPEPSVPPPEREPLAGAPEPAKHPLSRVQTPDRVPMVYMWSFLSFFRNDRAALKAFPDPYGRYPQGTIGDDKAAGTIARTREDVARAQVDLFTRQGKKPIRDSRWQYEAKMAKRREELGIAKEAPTDTTAKAPEPPKMPPPMSLLGPILPSSEEVSRRIAAKAAPAEPKLWLVSLPDTEQVERILRSVVKTLRGTIEE